MVEIWQILEVSDISTSLQGMMMVGTGGGWTSMGVWCSTALSPACMSFANHLSSM